MTKCPGINHPVAVRALARAGFKLVRQGKQGVTGDGERMVTIPRHNPVQAFTTGGVAKDAGLALKPFKQPL